MRKKSKFFGLMLMIVGFVCALIFCVDFSCEKKANASTSAPDITRSTYTSYDFDQTLFEAVLAMAKQLNCNQALIGRGFDVDLFLKNTNPSYSPSYVENGVGNDDYEENIAARNQIVNDLRNGVLDLTTGQNAKYDSLKNVNPIKSITGLNSMSLSFVKKLTLNENLISKIEKTDLENFTGLQELKAENNNIGIFELNQNIQNLSILDLSGNSISAIDLSELYNNAIVDLSNNNIADKEDIVFSANPSKKLSSLDLDFNFLDKMTIADVNTMKAKVVGSFNFGVQGLSDIVENVAGNSISIFNLEGNTLTNVSVVISYFGGNANETKSDCYVAGESNVICSTQGNSGIEKIFLPAGKVIAKFYNNGALIDSDTYPNYAPRILKVKMPKIGYSVVFDGKEVDKTYLENDFDVRFYVENSESIPNIDDVLENCKIFVGVGDGSSTEGNVVTVNKNGTFNCYGYCVFDGIESQRAVATVTRKYLTGILIGIVIIVSIIVVIGTGYFVARWYMAGANVAPLSDKELAALNRKKAKREEEVRETFVKGSGKSRYFAKRENSEDVLTGLNSRDDVNAHYNANEESDYNKDNYGGEYQSVTNQFDRYNQEEYRNDFDNNDANMGDGSENGDGGNLDGGNGGDNGDDEIRW